ncbi:hypothetical protein ACFFSY_07055 [Paenibacillus aurantiacus]|uniref:Uncharacterized protein n=1 Tax=Paenibacillus aurantiacus TaxID=1936118 RepID=A0ABV5KL96_9BACL
MALMRRVRITLHLILSLVLFASGAAALASADRWFAGTQRTAGAPGGPALHVRAASAASEWTPAPGDLSMRASEDGPELSFFARLGLLIAIDLAAVSAMLVAISRVLRDIRALRGLSASRRGEAG